MLTRAQKQEWASTFKEKLAKSKVAVFADYKGLKSGSADDLRRKLRAVDCEVKVLKNRIARKAVTDGAMGPEVKGLLDKVVGPVLVAFAYNDPAAVSKVLKDFAKDNEAFVLRDSLMGQRQIRVADVEALASLPGKEQLQGMLLSVFNAPARNFVSLMAAVPRGFVQVLSAYEGKRKEAGN